MHDLSVLETLRVELERYCSLPGVSGNEEPVLSALAEDMQDCADHTSRDGFSNLLVSLDGPEDDAEGDRRRRRPLLLAAHADEKACTSGRCTRTGWLRSTPSASTGVVCLRRLWRYTARRLVLQG